MNIEQVKRDLYLAAHHEAAHQHAFSKFGVDAHGRLWFNEQAKQDPIQRAVLGTVVYNVRQANALGAWELALVGSCGHAAECVYQAGLDGYAGEMLIEESISALFALFTFESGIVSDTDLNLMGGDTNSVDLEKSVWFVVEEWKEIQKLANKLLSELLETSQQVTSQ